MQLAGGHPLQGEVLGKRLQEGRIGILHIQRSMKIYKIQRTYIRQHTTVAVLYYMAVHLVSDLMAAQNSGARATATTNCVDQWYRQFSREYTVCQQHIVIRGLAHQRCKAGGRAARLC